SGARLRWHLIEVKGSVSVKDYHRADVSIQHWIARKNRIPLASVSVAHIDTSFVYPGDGDYRGLFHVEDLTGEVRARAREVATWVREAQGIAAGTAPPGVEMGDQCHHPYACGFCGHC